MNPQKQGPKLSGRQLLALSILGKNARKVCVAFGGLSGYISLAPGHPLPIQRSPQCCGKVHAWTCCEPRFECASRIWELKSQPWTSQLRSAMNAAQDERGRNLLQAVCAKGFMRPLSYLMDMSLGQIWPREYTHTRTRTHRQRKTTTETKTDRDGHPETDIDSNGRHRTRQHAHAHAPLFAACEHNALLISGGVIVFGMTS